MCETRGFELLSVLSALHSPLRILNRLIGGLPPHTHTSYSVSSSSLCKQLCLNPVYISERVSFCWNFTFTFFMKGFLHVTFKYTSLISRELRSSFNGTHFQNISFQKKMEGSKEGKRVLRRPHFFCDETSDGSFTSITQFLLPFHPGSHAHDFAT